MGGCGGLSRMGGIWCREVGEEGGEGLSTVRVCSIIWGVGGR